jgi:hypothetical protein
MKKMYVAFTVILTMSLCAASAMAWGSATHAYIDERLNSKGPLLKLNQVYGGMATDIFTLEPGLQAVYLSNEFHCADGYAMWGGVSSSTTKALAYGFISHNQVWGADYFAHNYGCAGQPPTIGYIKWKADILHNLLPSELRAYLDSLPNGLGIELVRSVVEYAVDTLLIAKDPAIGAKVSAAAMWRDPDFPELLSAAFQDIPSAYVSEVEEQFRQAMISYGQILSLGQLGAIKQISNMAASLAQQLYGITIDSATIKSAMVTAMWLCAFDHMAAINQTILGVRYQMIGRGFYY